MWIGQVKDSFLAALRENGITKSKGNCYKKEIRADYSVFVICLIYFIPILYSFKNGRARNLFPFGQLTRRVRHSPFG